MLGKIAVDQLLWSPCFIVAFFSSMALLAGESAVDRVRNNFVASLLATWRLWPAVQLVNFWLVPPPLRVAFVNCVQVLFSAYLSMLANAKT